MIHPRREKTQTDEEEIVSVPEILLRFTIGFFGSSITERLTINHTRIGMVIWGLITINVATENSLNPTMFIPPQENMLPV